jgi:hypothetical protein
MEDDQMPKFTVEVTYYVPTFTHVVVEADDAALAAKKALDEVQWEDAEFDYDSSTAEKVTGIWAGECTAYEGTCLPIPEEYAMPDMPH